MFAEIPDRLRNPGAGRIDAPSTWHACKMESIHSNLCEPVSVSVCAAC